jgi:hypothetical protein
MYTLYICIRTLLPQDSRRQVSNPYRTHRTIFSPLLQCAAPTPEWRMTDTAQKNEQNKKMNKYGNNN